ncbi:unnamed protein product [Prunus armeniaca]
MESARIARCSYGAVTVVIALFEHSKYADICNEMCLRFKELKDGNHATSNHAGPDHAPYSHAVSNRAAPDHAASNDATSDHAAVDHGASNHATPGAPNHALSAGAMSNHTTSNDATSNHAASSDAISNHTASNDVISNHAASNDAIFNHAACGDAISNHVASNHLASSSCMLDSSAFDENEHLGTSRFHEGKTYFSQGWKEYINNVGQKFEGGVVEFRNKLCKSQIEVNMRNLKHEGGAPVMTFLDLPKESWSYAYFKGNRYGEMCNNASESFNSWIFELRALPICQMVDGIRSKLLKMMAEWSRKAEQWCSVLCPVMERTLNERLMVGRNWNVSRCSASVYDVHAEICVKVDLANRLCSCHEWQIKGFPCVHALVAIQKDSGCIHEYTDDHFKSSYFRCSYAFSISPIPDIKNVMHEGSEDVIMPPLTKKRRGRPMTKMPKSVGEV